VAGGLLLRLAGTVTAVDWTLDLWNAELTGTVTTTRGSLAFTALVHVTRHVLIVQTVPSPGEEAATWRANGPDGAALPRHERDLGTRRLLVAAIPPGSPEAAGEAVTTDPDVLLATHRRWWHDFHRRSAVSIGDKWVQRFYCIQLYKAASLSRTDPATGQARPLLLRAGHLGLNPTDPAPLPVGRVGGFGIPGTGFRAAQDDNPVAGWALPERWLSYRLSRDSRVLRDDLYPALDKALRFYQSFLLPGADGYLHLPVTHSPHYTDMADCTYDLSLLRWAATRAADCARLLRRPKPEAARWQDLHDRLVPYHRDGTGVMVGAGVPLGGSHPLPSHLLWLHPLGERAWERGDDPGIAWRSYAHWAAMADSWHGRSYAAAASMAAVLGAADEAHGRLSHLLGSAGRGTVGLTEDTPYDEAGHSAESGALAAAGSLLDMLARAGDHADGGTLIEIFPATSAAWPDVSVSGLRVEGALTLDASRAGGRTRWVRVRSDTGGEVVVRHGIGAAAGVRATDGGELAWQPSGPGEVVLRLPAGGDAVVVPAGSPLPDLGPRNVTPTGSASRWGLPAAGPAARSAG
jgi:hypothetical protein